MPIVIGATIQTDPRPLRRSLDRDAKMAERTLGGAFRNIGRIGTSAITGIGRAMRRLISLPAVIGAGLAGFGLDRLIRQGAELEFQIGALAAQLSKSREEVSRYVSQIDQGTAGMLGFGGAIKAANRALQQGVPADAVAELTRQVTLLRTAAGSADGIENDLDMLFRAVGKGTNEGLGRLGLRLDTSSLQGLSTEERRARVLQQVLEGLREQTQALNVTGREAYFTYTGIYGNIKDITVELGRAVTRTEEFRNIALVLNRLTGSIAERLRKGDMRKALGEIFEEVMNVARALSADLGEAIAVGVGRGLRTGLGVIGVELDDILGKDAAERTNRFLDDTNLFTRTPRALGQAVGRFEGPAEVQPDDDKRWDPIGVRFRRELERLRQRNPLPEIDPDMSRDDQRDMLRQRREIEQQQRRHAMDMARQRRLPPTAEQDADTESQTALNRATDRGPTGPGLGSVIGEQFGDAINERVGQAGVAMAVSFVGELNKQRQQFAMSLGAGLFDENDGSTGGDLGSRLGQWSDNAFKLAESLEPFMLPGFHEKIGAAIMGEPGAWNDLGRHVLDGITDLDRWRGLGESIWGGIKNSPFGQWILSEREKHDDPNQEPRWFDPRTWPGMQIDPNDKSDPMNRPISEVISVESDPEGFRKDMMDAARAWYETSYNPPASRRWRDPNPNYKAPPLGERLGEAADIFGKSAGEQRIEIDVMQGLKDGGRFLLDAFIERSRQRTPQLRMRDEAREQEDAGANAERAADQMERLNEAMARLFHSGRALTNEMDRMTEHDINTMA